MLRCLKLTGVDDELAGSVGLYEVLNVPLALGTGSSSALGSEMSATECSEHESQGEDRKGIEDEKGREDETVCTNSP